MWSWGGIFSAVVERRIGKEIMGEDGMRMGLGLGWGSRTDDTDRYRYGGRGL